MPKGAADWDAQTYHRVSEPQFAWGVKVLEKLPLTGSEVVLDAGCGTGRVTAELLNRLPAGRLVALDVSSAMLEEARALLDRRFPGRVFYVLSDLLELRLEGVADVIFSTATFHWVKDHDRLFRNLLRALRPNGKLWAQCGGGDNLKKLYTRVRRLMALPRFKPHFRGWKDFTNYQGVAATKRRLKAAGFVDVDVTLEAAPTPFPSRAAFGEFLGAVVLRNHLARLPRPLSRELVEALLDEYAKDTSPWELDYWRLNLRARAPQARRKARPRRPASRRRK
jgi:trans-aconitate methyltransferase